MINLQPPFDALPAYRPIAFELQISLPNGTQAENALVNIYKDGAVIGPVIRFKSSANAPSTFPGQTDWFFEIDIQKYCQDTLGPNTGLPSTFPDDTVANAVLNNDLFGLYRIEVEYEQINPTTGLLEDAGIPTDVSNNFYVYSITRQHLEIMDLLPFIDRFATPPSTFFLTKSSKLLTVCEEDNAFLSWIQPNLAGSLSGFEVSIYDSSGGLLSNGLGQTAAPAFSAQMTLNTGISALSAQPYLTGPPNFADPNAASYTVTVGTVIPVGMAFLYVAISEVITYQIKPSCCGTRDLRLHWLNQLGGTDSYTFNSEKDLVLTTTSDRAQKALDWVIGDPDPHNKSDIGNFKIKSEGSTAYVLKSRYLTNQEALWLSDLLNSPKVYAWLDNAFVPVIIEDTQQSITRHQGKIQFEITATLSNDLIIQRI